MRDKRSLTLAGARAYELVEHGELWRHLSCVFLHGDLLHLTVNTLALFALGRVCEALYGPTRLLALFLLTGLGGSLLSHAGGTPLSVGASGAVFGLLGLAVSFGLRHREVLPRSLSRVLGLGLLPWLAFNLLLGLALLFKGTVRELLGFTPPALDLLAHLGGLGVGLVLGAALPSRAIPWEHPRRWVTTLAGLLSASALLWTALSLAGSLMRKLG
ncbi:MAG: rhomboid family intramembrane serine protease [Alphaproteobacteria bacterium]|nr:rhomboid family intramembrane serine protease [Alphaproteobacteria bacterium]